MTNLAGSKVVRTGAERARLLLVAVLLSIAGLTGCGGTTAGTDASTTDGGPPVDPVLYDELAPSDCTITTCGSTQVLTACVCAPRTAGAGFETVRTACSQITGGVTRTPERDFCVDGPTDSPPDLSCMMTPPSVGETQDVTLYGVVDVFGNGPDADEITIEIYEEGADGELGAMVATTTATIDSPCAEEEIEVDAAGVPTGEARTLGFYSVTVPTETPLILLTRGSPGLWSPLYTYNFVVLNSDVETAAPPASACSETPTGPRARYRARVLALVDYQSIPITANLSGGIRAGNGAIAGEVHDCGDVRLELASVGMTGSPLSKVYFNDIADNPLPNAARTQGTSLLGLYAGLDIAPGPVDVTAIGYVGGQTVSLGWYRVRVFPNAVTSVTLRGIRAHQVE